MKINSKDIGIEVEIPKELCNDKHCSFHGSLVVRGRQFIGLITRMNAQKTAVVELDRLSYIPKYERYEKRRTRIKAHISPCIKVGIGEKVRIVECRPISKTKNFVIVGVEK